MPEQLVLMTAEPEPDRELGRRWLSHIFTTLRHIQERRAAGPMHYPADR